MRCRVESTGKAPHNDLLSLSCLSPGRTRACVPLRQNHLSGLRVKVGCPPRLAHRSPCERSERSAL